MEKYIDENTVTCDICKLQDIMSWQAMTTYICKNCGKWIWYHCTATPIYCTECAKLLKRCIRCTGKISTNKITESYKIEHRSIQERKYKSREHKSWL